MPDTRTEEQKAANVGRAYDSITNQYVSDAVLPGRPVFRGNDEPIWPPAVDPGIQPVVVPVAVAGKK